MFDALDDVWPRVVGRAALAPSIHNTQPWAWQRTDGGAVLYADWSRQVPEADPQGHGLLLSCGAALEATGLALSALRIGATITAIPGRRTCDLQPVARIETGPGAEDPLQRQLEARATWRGAFEARQPRLFGWSRDDTLLVTDAARPARLAELNDAAGLRLLRRRGVRRELLGWMRLRDGHPRRGIDGMDRAALGLGRGAALGLRLTWGPAFRMLDLVGAMRPRLAEAALTATAPVIAAFHRPAGEDPVESGRAYLRMWLEATSLGFAGWPMAALTDDPAARAEVIELLKIGPDRDLVQVIRFGQPTGTLAPRARRPEAEVLK